MHSLGALGSLHSLMIQGRTCWNNLCVLLRHMNKILLIILAIFLPPAAVAAKSGISQQFWINLILTLLFFVPGMIHALIVVI